MKINTSKIIAFLVILLGMFFSNNTSAQYYVKETSKDDPVIFKENTVSFDLTSLFSRGLGITYTRKIIDKNRIAFSPVYYSHNNYGSGNDNNSKDYVEMRGVGMGIHGVFYTFISTTYKYSLFFSYGGAYNYFNLNDSDKNNTEIQQFSADLSFGYHQIIKEVFFIDISAGLGTKKSNLNYSEYSDNTQLYNKTWLSPGYTGNYITFGIGIGVIF